MKRRQIHWLPPGEGDCCELVSHPESRANAAERAKKEGVMQANNQIVYVVDDQIVIAETLAMILRRSGFVAISFDDPASALAAVRTAPPDLLLSDVMMPGMTGVALAIEVRKLLPRCKVLLFSGTAATSPLLEAARSQGYDFELLLKPVHPADLLAKLEAQWTEKPRDREQIHGTKQ